MPRSLKFSTIQNALATALVLGTLAFASGNASASNCHSTRCYWKTVTVYETVLEPCVHYVTRHDHCGKPYQVKVVSYKSVQVPVQKRIKVCY
ncbi:MAG: hypothetical protein KDA66_07270 [Planctomycetaceae bacterium]|nr:hypothetical protein [Planctomycetaceae bacterium]